jgi:hypothetical protein
MKNERKALGRASLLRPNNLVIQSKVDMRYFARLVLAVALRAREEERTTSARVMPEQLLVEVA